VTKVDVPFTRELLGRARKALLLAQEMIDAVGDQIGSDDADQLACYASNGVQGTLALLREIEQRWLKGKP
jgi:hypothetical protein